MSNKMENGVLQTCEELGIGFVPWGAVVRGFLGSFSWRTAYESCKTFSEKLNAAGGQAEMWYLPDMGIKGNSHMIMMDNNHLEIAYMVMEWMVDKKIRTPEEHPNLDKLKIRMAEIEIDSTYFDEYLTILKKEAAESVKLEEGVLCIYPMYQKENPTQIRLLEIYASEEAYQSHLKTPHFLHYKTTTLPMVKSLKLIDMEAIDKEIMSDLFEKKN